MEAPNKIKHYDLISRLGEGGMGVVYRARDTRLGRIVALKMLPPALAADDERIRRFEREARIVSSISHPGIATLYDVDRSGKTAFITMELVEGSTLRELLARGPIPMDELTDCAAQVADALAAAHREGVVHRDLKPENVMAARSGFYKVLDFGVARREEIRRPLGVPGTQTPTRTWATREGALVGTVAYMSPEQVMGRPVDARSDVFSFGSLLYELATGTPAFRGNNEVALAHAIAYEDPPAMDTVRPEVPAELEGVVRKCLAKNPQARYANAIELAEDLRELRLDRLSLTRTVERRRSLGLKPERNWRRPIVVAAALAAAAVLAVMSFRQGGDSVEPPAPRTPAEPSGAATAVTTEGRPRVVIAFFKNNSGDPQADWLSRGLPEMLTTDLARSDGLEVIATQRLRDLVAAGGGDAPEALDRSTETELARWAGADLVIGGSVFKAGGSYRIDAQAYHTDSGAVAAAYKVEGTDLFRMVSELTSGLRRGLSVAGGDAGGLPGVTTSSPDAYRAFVQGKTSYDNLMFDEAASAFREALDHDPEFADAKLRLAMSLLLAGDRDSALPLLEQAHREAQRMPEAEGLLASALHASFVEDDLEAGASRFERLLERFPRHPEAHVWWGQALMERGRDPLGASRKLRASIEQDPNNLLGIAALAKQLAEFGRLDDARGILLEAAQRNPEAEQGIRRLLETRIAVP